MQILKKIIDKIKYLHELIFFVIFIFILRSRQVKYLNLYNFVAFLLLPLFLLPQSANAAEEHETEELKREITISGDIDYPPYSFIDENGVRQGISVDIAQAIAAKMGITMNINLEPWSKAQSDLLNGNIDMVFNMAFFESRRSQYAFSNSYVSGNIYVYRHKKAEKPSTLSDLDGKHVVIVQGDYSLDFLRRNNSSAIITLVPNYADAFLVLNRCGGIDYLVIDENTASYWIHKLNLTNIYKTDLKLFMMNYCFATVKSNNYLVKNVDMALSRLMQTGEYDKIYSKWMDKYTRNATGFILFLKVNYWIGVIIPIIILMLLLWNNQLRSKLKIIREINKEKTDIFNNSSNHYLSLLNMNPALQLVIDKNYRIIAIYGGKNFDIDPYYYQGALLLDLFEGELLETLLKKIREVLQTREKQVFGCSIIRFKHEFSYDFQLMFSSSEEVLIIMRDITFLRNREVVLENRLKDISDQNDILVRLNTAFHTAHELNGESVTNFNTVDGIPNPLFNNTIDELNCITFIVEFGISGKEYYLSENCEKITGYPASDFRDKKRMWFETLVKEDYDKFKQVLDNAIINMTNYEYVYRIYRKDGDIHWMYQRGKFYPGTGNNIWINKGFILDITDSLTQSWGFIQKEHGYSNSINLQ